MILLIVCVVIAAVLFLVWGVKQNIIGVMLLRLDLLFLLVLFMYIKCIIGQLF